MKRFSIFLICILTLVACQSTPAQKVGVVSRNAFAAQSLPTNGVMLILSGDQIVEVSCDVGSPVLLDRVLQCAPGTPVPTATNTTVPTNTPAPTNQPTATSTPNAPIEPFISAPVCPDSSHNDRNWHGIWNEQLGCHFGHTHRNDPHELDDIFGTEFYDWAGGEISYPWQTFTGAGDGHEHPGPESAMENQGKHNGYSWLTVRDFPCAANIPGILNGAQNCITDARLQFHAHLTQVDALVRFHSVWLEAIVCNVGVSGPENCGIYRGGGHLDLGRLNLPRGTCYQLPNDPSLFCNDGLAPEREPYRIHTPCDNPVFGLDSWQSEGNDTYVITDTLALSVGYGVHFDDPWGCTNPEMQGNPLLPENVALTDFICYGESGCNFNSSEMALFRLWVRIPDGFDGSQFDTDPREGYFSYSGYTDRYGVPVTGCTEPGLDCVPIEAVGVPVGTSRLRANNLILNQDFDYHICNGAICDEPDAPSVDWIEYP